MMNLQTTNAALLVLPRLRVQNANAISSSMTWGFPSITAFTGLMTALARRLGPNAGIVMHGVGVICHSFEPQVSRSGYQHTFHLTRNPVLQDGSTAAIVEEARAHLDITLIFDADISSEFLVEAERVKLADQISEILAGMRVAGGSVVPPLPGVLRNPPRPQLLLVPEDADERRKMFRKLCRHWLPGYALVSRDDLLQVRHAKIQQANPTATLLDAWLDLSRLNHHAIRHHTPDEKVNATSESIEWVSDTRSGWIVPIPVGFSALSELHAPGTVLGARDPELPFRFVESVYSMGQWISPHRLNDAAELFWQPFHDPDSGLYRCINSYVAPSSPLFQI